MADILTGLVGYWTFDSTPNDSVGTNHGTWTGTPAYVTGQIGNAADFPGGAAATYIEMTRPAPFGDISVQSHSIACWAKPDLIAAGSTFDRLIAIQEGVSDYVQITTITAGTGLQYIVEDATTQRGFSGTVSVGEWVHLVGTWNHSTDTVAFYINAVAQSGSTNLAAQGSHTTMRIGARDSNVTTFDGAIDELRVYDRVLPLEDIQALHAFTGATGLSIPVAMHHRRMQGVS